MNYGPTSKQLDAVKLRPVKSERPDGEGWYQDGERDAQKGRPADYGCIKLAHNQVNYLAGYIDGKGWERPLPADGYADGGEPYANATLLVMYWQIIREQ